MLQVLRCNGTGISYLDLTNNAELTYLSCGETNLSKLDVSHCPLLKQLQCEQTKIAELDVSANPALIELSCFETLITKLDLSKNMQLDFLDCSQTNISTLDLSGNAALVSVCCDGLSMPAIDLSKNVSLSWAAVSSRISAPAKAKGDGYTVDLGALVGRENRERIVFVSTGEYDAATGLVTFETLPTDFTYNYDFHNDYTRERSLTVVVDVRFRSVWRSVLLWAIPVVVLVPTVILLAVHLRRRKEKAQ